MEYICPNCKKPIYDDEAMLCLYCGESLRRPTKTVLGVMRSHTLRFILIALVAVLIISFLFIQLRS